MRLTSATKEHPAFKENGERSIHGYFDGGDIQHLAAVYPRIGQETVARVAGAINAPRLLEVSTVIEVAHRYLEGAYTKIRGMAIRAATNPLSVLYWNEKRGRVQRIKTRETELMHGASEKLALRTDGVARVNGVLQDTFGLRLAFGCSCCVIVVREEDATALFNSDYYRQRESFGRLYDSDVLCTSGDLFDAESVTDLSPQVLARTADFHEEEVASYVRFAAVNESIVRQNPAAPYAGFNLELARFLNGELPLAA